MPSGPGKEVVEQFSVSLGCWCWLISFTGISVAVTWISVARIADGIAVAGVAVSRIAGVGVPVPRIAVAGVGVSGIARASEDLKRLCDLCRQWRDGGDDGRGDHPHEQSVLD